MKSIKLIFLFIAFLTKAMASDKKIQTNFSDYVEGYIVGYFQCPNQNLRSYCIILKNESDSIYSFTLPENIILAKTLKSGHDVYTGGPFFSPDSLRNKFLIKFKYRISTDSESIKCPLPYNTLGPTFSWENWNQAIIKNVIKLF